MERIGIYGGTFNPPHAGHMQAAKQAVTALKLDKLVIVPTSIAPHKAIPEHSPTPRQRLEMLRIAAADCPKAEVSDIELNRGGVSYTFQTVSELKERYPDAELILLMGSDMFLSFPKWHCWQEILEMAALGVVSRMTGDLEQLRRQQAFLLQYGKIFLCDVPVYTVSSTKIRENRKNHTDFSCYLPQKVVQYIVSHNLYD